MYYIVISINAVFSQSPHRWFHFSHLFLSIHPSVSSPARHPPSIVQRTTLQSITITSRKESVKEEEQRNRIEPPPALTLRSPSTPTSSPPVSSPLSPPAQPSLLASLLARKRSIVTVPATKEVSSPLRGSSHPSPDRLPYLPHSPFHLFSYDLDEEPSPPAPAKPSEESPKTTSPRSAGQPDSFSHEFKKHRKLSLHLSDVALFLFSVFTSASHSGTSLDLFASLLSSSLPFFFTHSFSLL